MFRVAWSHFRKLLFRWRCKILYFLLYPLRTAVAVKCKCTLPYNIIINNNNTWPPNTSHTGRGPTFYFFFVVDTLAPKPCVFLFDITLYSINNNRYVSYTAAAHVVICAPRRFTWISVIYIIDRRLAAIIMIYWA